MRGNSSFITMKGFLDDFTVKGDGHTEETLPEDTGQDITETAELDSAMANAPKGANIKSSDNKPTDPATTMSDELEDIEDKSNQDIADGYVADVQNLPGPGDREKKGWEQFNELVAKGIIVDHVGMNRYNVGPSLDMIEKSAEMAFENAASGMSDWMGGGGDDMTVFKGASALDMVFKGDPEDMGVDEGVTEEGDSGSTEEENDDTKETVGENDAPPQTEGSFSEEGPEEEKGAWSEGAKRIAGNVAEKLGRGAYKAQEFAGRQGKKLGKVKQHSLEAGGPTVRERVRTGAQRIESAGERGARDSEASRRLGRRLAIGGGAVAGTGAAGAGGYHLLKDKKKD